MDMVPSAASADSSTKDSARREERDKEEPQLEEVGRTLLAPRLYRGKINHVHSVCVADITIHVEEFGSVAFSYRCFLTGIPDIRKNDKKFNEARRCTIMLLGGRDVIVETVKCVPPKSNLAAVIVYRRGAVPCSDCNLPIDDVDYLNVNRYLDWLSRQATPFDSTIVAQHRRGLA